MNNSTLLLVWVALAVVGFVGVVAYDTATDENAEGEIVDLYIDTDGTDTFKAILRKDGTYYAASLYAKDYYSHEIGDWFSGNVKWAEKLKSEGW